jgi:hypothetical protein
MKKIQINKEKLNELISRYPNAKSIIEKNLKETEEKYNANPSFAKFQKYKVYINEIGETFYFDYEKEGKVEEHIEIDKIDKRIIEILKDPKIFDKITTGELDKKIVREYPVRKAIFLCGNGRLVKNSQIASFNLLINDEAGTGKDYVTSKTLEIFPKDIYIKKTRISPTVFTYWHNSQYESEWTWDGKIFYTEDISESVLNSEVFKVMCSSGSEATIVIKQRAIDISIEGKPVMITTTATSIPNSELTRRFEIINLDESINQTKEIMKRHCEYAKTGISPEYNPDYTKAMSYLKRVNVRIPFADKLYLLFPTESVMMRTKFPRFLDFIKASASFHQFQRKWENEDTIFAEQKDYEIACEIMEKIASNRYLVSLTRRQKKIMEYLESKTKKNFEFKQSASKIREGMGNFISLPAICTNLSQLASYGLLKVELRETERGREVEEYSVHENILNGVHTIIFPRFEDLKNIN